MAVSREASKDKTLDQVLSDIEKQFGKGSIMKLGDNHFPTLHNKLTELASSEE